MFIGSQKGNQNKNSTAYRLHDLIRKKIEFFSFLSVGAFISSLTENETLTVSATLNIGNTAPAAFDEP